MNKKSQDPIVSMYDIAAILILVLGAIVWIYVLRFDASRKNIIIQDEISELNNNDNFVNILRTEVSGKKISDLLTDSYISNKPELIRGILDGMLNATYGAEVCWKMFANEKSFINFKCDSGPGKELLDSTIMLPFKTTPNKFQLIVTGYKK